MLLCGVRGVCVDLLPEGHDIASDVLTKYFVRNIMSYPVLITFIQIVFHFRVVIS